MEFWLGTHEPSWLRRLDVPLFISYRRLKRQYMSTKRMPRALVPWALDSGGFTELSTYGAWQTSKEEYIEAVGVYVEAIGNLAWAAPMDWMCEPFVLAKTGLTVGEHQERTVANYLELRETGLPFIPVLQGFTEEEYHHCVDLYRWCGVDLAELPLVGIGSVCRRQHTEEIRDIVKGIAERGISLHGFGVKKTGFPMYAKHLTSADSMAWSTRGRSAWRHKQVKLCGGSHKGGCANCIDFAVMWRSELLELAPNGDRPARPVVTIG